jgi:hypothetical protein
MKIKLIILFISIQIGVFGQSSFDGINTSLIKPWFPKFEIEYQAVYHFGDSEWESKLILIRGFDKWYAQIVRGSWYGEGNQLVWALNYQNLSNVRVEANKFYSDKTNGEFVLYDGNNARIKGLKVYNSWSGEDGLEIGYKTSSLQENYSGKFTQASLRELSIDELRKMTTIDLKIMRNEIFARYGYRFKLDGKMDLYFQHQNWYKREYGNVDDFLTDLEKENIKLIRQIENQ